MANRADCNGNHAVGSKSGIKVTHRAPPEETGLDRPTWSGSVEAKTGHIRVDAAKSTQAAHGVN